MRTTHTCAILQLSPAAYAEIRTKLKEAGYDHAFGHETEDGEWIDMSGIGVQAEPAPNVPSIEAGADPRRDLLAIMAASKTDWGSLTAELENENEPEGMVILKNAEGVGMMCMSRVVFEAFRTQGSRLRVSFS